MNRKELGNTSEKIAKNFLKKKGYRIRETNFRCREGEIDIIAEKKAASSSSKSVPIPAPPSAARRNR